MCGIAGIFDFLAPSAIDRSLAQRMNDAIAHRGPDGEGLHLEPGVALMHRRLAIIDLSGGHQPMFNADETVAITFNGEIYNYKELMAELQSAGYTFRTRSDTEVIIHAWEEWGAECVKRLRGMFAFAIHDRKRQTLFLARDRFGKKPIYYTIVGGRHLLFASELKALLAHPMVERRIDPLAVDNYLAYGYVPDPDSIYDGIKKLPAAHHLTVVRGQSSRVLRSYWQLHFTGDLSNEEEAERALAAKLEESTRIRLMSEVPLGAFLSGGVDSSAVVAMMARNLDTPAKTFAVGFDDNNDELPHALRVAERYHTEHRSETVNVDPIAVYRRQAAIFDEPFADSSAVPTLHVCGFARRHVTVALSGDAGDENFAGYRRYRLFGAAERWRHLIPGAMRQPVFGTLARLYPKLDWAPRWLRAKYTFAELAADSSFGYYRTVCKIHDGVRQRLYSGAQRRATDGHDASAMIAQAMDESGSDDPISRAQYADIKTYLTGDILTKVDRTSMAVSLEVRVPMLDHEFAELAARMPSGMKIKGGEQKYILKKMLEPYVPHENLYRRKQGFATSLAPYFRGTRAPALKAALTGAAMGDSGLFDIKALGAMADAHASGAADHSQALWSLLMFEGFLREVHFREGAPISVKASAL